MTPNHAAQVPDGPFMSFQAIPHPLPEVVQARLKIMSVVMHDAGEHNGPVLESFDEYLNKVRDVLGVEHLRREFLPNRRPIG
jgi:hypothetical protein